MNIPARYCTGYLGDIGVPASDAPMDFSAWFEAYLGGEWYTFDARNNIPRIGRVLIARGRDAADVAISTSFGPNTLSSFTVWTEECEPRAGSALSRLRARRWSGSMADNNRRPEHPICGDANKQEDRDHDRRNEVFHGCFLLKTRRRNPARSPARPPARLPAKTPPSTG